MRAPGVAAVRRFEISRKINRRGRRNTLVRRFGSNEQTNERAKQRINLRPSVRPSPSKFARAPPHGDISNSMVARSRWPLTQTADEISPKLGVSRTAHRPENGRQKSESSLRVHFLRGRVNLQEASQGKALSVHLPACKKEMNEKDRAAAAAACVSECGSG
jgi:hypothetical protein